MTRLRLVLPVLCLLGCSTSRGTQEEAVPAPFTIVDARVDGDSLRTTLQFGGGFRQHTFTLESAGSATKSLPRQQPLRLLHDADGDLGRALLTEERAFDLRPYRDPSQDRIQLWLEGWETKLDYPYAP